MGGSSASTVNGAARVASSWPTPKKPWISVRVWPPSTQALAARNSNLARAGSATTAAMVAERRSRSTPLTVFRTVMSTPRIGGGSDQHTVLAQIARSVVLNRKVRPIVLGCQCVNGYDDGKEGAPRATFAEGRRAHPRHDPAGGRVVGHGGRARRTVHRESGCGDRHEQERPLRALRFQGGVATGHRRRSRTHPHRRSDPAGTRRRARTGATGRSVRSVLQLRGAPRLPRRLLLRRHLVGDGYPPWAGQGPAGRHPS